MSKSIKHDSKRGYHHFLSEHNGEYGSFEVIWLDKKRQETPYDEYEGKYAPSGWYWVAGFPGCLWDGDPMGPFNSSGLAYKDAREGY